jgi:hypothetical protein
MTIRVGSLVVLLLVGAGCAGSGGGPVAPVAGGHQIGGVVQRSGAPVVGQKVKLYDDLEGIQLDSTFTAADGSYGFDGVGIGKWLVKVSPASPDDLGYVRWFFDLSSAGAAVAVPPLDVAAHGFVLQAPDDASRMARPSFSSSLDFSWSAYGAPYLWASVRLSDSTGVLAWSSNQEPSTQASWNGVGNEGSYSGRILAPGRYVWRVKLRLPNSVQAASHERVLFLD